MCGTIHELDPRRNSAILPCFNFLASRSIVPAFRLVDAVPDCAVTRSPLHTQQEKVRSPAKATHEKRGGALIMISGHDTHAQFKSAEDGLHGSAKGQIAESRHLGCSARARIAKGRVSPDNQPSQKSVHCP